MKLTNNTHEKVEKIIWVISHYIVFAAAVSVAYYGNGSDILIAACVFMWVDFAIYLLELAMFLNLARTSL